MNKKERLIRIAGYFDGDGCVYIGRTMKKHYGIAAKITCCSIRMLREIVDCTNIGRIYQYKDRGYWAWHINRRKDTLKFLKLIAPYSLVKKDEIDLILNFWPKLRARKPILRHKLYLHIKELKRKAYELR